MAITNQEIHAIANKITEEGGSPTLAAVRKAIGGGSYTTISDAMQEWRTKQQTSQVVTLIREAAPTVVGEKLTAFGGEIWVIALEMANARLKSEREALEKTRKDMEDSKKEAVDLADQISIELEQAQATIDLKIQAIVDSEAKVIALASDLEMAKSAKEKSDRNAETSAAALTEAHDHVKALSDDVANLKLEIKMLSKSLSDSTREAMDFKSKLDISNERLDVSIRTIELNNSNHNLELGKLIARLTEKDEAIKELSSKLEVAQIKASDSAQAVNLLQGKLEAMKEQGDLYEAYMGAIKKLDEAAIDKQH